MKSISHLSKCYGVSHPPRYGAVNSGQVGRQHLAMCGGCGEECTLSIESAPSVNQWSGNGSESTGEDFNASRLGELLQERSLFSGLGFHEGDSEAWPAGRGRSWESVFGFHRSSLSTLTRFCRHTAVKRLLDGQFGGFTYLILYPLIMLCGKKTPIAQSHSANAGGFAVRRNHTD